MLNALWVTLFLIYGSAFADPEQHIVGGQEARPPGKYPWQGYLERGAINPSFSCGCILVGQKTALTAAHCADSAGPEDYFLTFGAHDRETEIEGKPETFGVVNIEVHPNWTNNGDLGFPNDIAVMELDRAIDPSNNYIQPIPLPDSGRGPNDWVDQDCWISGWGRLSGGGQLPNLLQEVNIPVITEEVCDERWTSIGYDVMSEIHVCVWDQQLRDKGSCNGDSGGPLVCRETEGADWELVGITSWGLSGCSTDYPSVYARVSTFREWVDTVWPEWIDY